MGFRHLLHSALELATAGWRTVVAHPSLLVVNVILVFLPVLLVQLAVPTFMRGRTSPLPGGALLGAVVIAALFLLLLRVAAARARRVAGGRATLNRGAGAVVLVGASLLVILLGQSVLAVIAEAIGVIRRAPSGPAAFTLDYGRYVLITVLAYAWTVSTLTLLVASLTAGHTAQRVPAYRWPRPARAAAACAAALALVAFAMKVAQHVL